MDHPTRGHQSSAATLAGVGAIMLWSFSGLCYAVGGRTLGAMPFICLSSVIGVATIILLHTGRGMPVHGLFKPPLRVAVAGVFGVVVYSLLLGSAMGMAAERDLAHVMLLNYLWPIWIVLLGLVLLTEPRRASRAVAGAVLGFGGVVMARGTEIFHYPAAALTPHAMAAAGGFLWATYSVLLRRWKVPVERGGSTFHFLVLSAVAGLIAIWQGSWHSLGAVDSRAWLITLFSGIGPVGLGYYWWEIGMKRGALHGLAVLSYFIPIASAVLIGLFFQQAMGPLLIPGAATIAVGAWLGQSAGKRPTREMSTPFPLASVAESGVPDTR